MKEVTLDFRSWINQAVDYDHWIGTIAREIRSAGWMGATPHSLREFLRMLGAGDERVREVDALEHFYRLFREREESRARAA